MGYKRMLDAKEIEAIKFIFILHSWNLLRNLYYMTCRRYIIYIINYAAIDRDTLLKYIIPSNLCLKVILNFNYCNPFFVCLFTMIAI